MRQDALTGYLDANAYANGAGNVIDVRWIAARALLASGEVVMQVIRDGAGVIVAMCFRTTIPSSGECCSTVTRTVHVVDTIAPVISLHGDSNITHEAGAAYISTLTRVGAIRWMAQVIVAGGEVNASDPGTYVLSYNYIDEAGNVAQTVTRTVRVVDTTAPVISLHGDSNITHEAGGAYMDANAS